MGRSRVSPIEGRGRARLSMGLAASVVCAAIPVLLSGCAPRIERLYHAEGFDYRSLRSDGIALGGVVTTVGDRQSRAASRDPLTRVLEAIFTQDRGTLDVNMVRPAQVRDRLGNEAHAQLLDDYEHAGALDPRSITLLDSVLAGQARYLALARIEDENIKRDQVSADLDGDPATHDVRHTKYTKRTVRVGLHVFDVRSGGLAWSGVAVGTQADSVSYDEEAQMGLLYRILGMGREPDYPPPPEVSAALVDPIEAFARALLGMK